MQIPNLDCHCIRTQQGKIEKIKSSFLKNEIVFINVEGCCINTKDKKHFFK